MSGTEFLAAEKEGLISTEEVLGASVMDRNLPGGKVEAGKFLQDEKVYDSDGNEYVVSKFKRVLDIDIRVKISGMGVGVKYKNVLTIKKNGKEVDRDISVKDFNKKYSLEKPGKTFKTYKEEKKILSPEEYPARKLEAEEYAISLGLKDDMSNEEKQDILDRVYEKYPELKSR